MKRVFLAAYLLCCFLMGWSQQQVIFETDMGNDVDDALALDMLYKYHAEGRIKLLGVTLNKEGIFPPQFIDITNTWYGQKRIPIGRSSREDGSVVAGNNYTKTVAEAVDAEGQPLYRRSIKHYDRLPDAVTLHRRLLSKAKDGSVTIVSVGFSTNLAALLDTKPDRYSKLSGRELVARKVDRLVMMAGNFAQPDHAEYNVVNDIPACQKVLAEWPTPVYCSGFEVGLDIRFPARCIREDFTWAEHHPMVDAYCAYLPQLEDRPTWDLTAVLFAVDAADRFGISPAGRIEITKEGYSRFTADPFANRFYLTVNAQQRKQILDYFVDMITKQPNK